MTNLLEKTLLTSLGILILICFLSLILPFWNQIFDFNIDSRNYYEAYSTIINELDQGIIFINENPDKLYQKQIDYPQYLNISVNDFYIKYEYILGDQQLNTIVEYQSQFLKNEYKNMPPQNYILKIFYQLNLIEIQIY